jgi:2-hydroxy-3-keto-5-methylthiopentenyl-1-phosphate phosphatase
MRVVLDWDGTCTVVDSLHLVLEEFGDRRLFERVEGQLLAGSISYRDLMELEFASVRAPLGEVVSFLLGEARLRPGLRELAAACDPLILSSGFHELIEPVLARDGLELRVVANRLDPRPDGWRIRWRDDAECPVCGDLCKRSGLPGGEVAFVGDGYSDRCAAGAAARVFARDGLAGYLEREAASYEGFEDFFDVLHALERPVSQG